MEVVDVKVVVCAGEEAVVDFAGVVEPSQECQHILIKSVNSLIVKSLLLLCLPQQSYCQVCKQPYSEACQ